MNTELRFGSVAPIWSPARTWRGARLRQGAFTGSGRLASHHPRMHHDALDVTYNPRWLSDERFTGKTPGKAAFFLWCDTRVSDLSCV